MTDLEAYRIENKFPVRAVESKEKGLKYLVDDDQQGIIISGMRGKTGLSIRQFLALLEEGPGIARDHLGVIV